MATIQVRVSDEDKKRAEAVLAALGLDMTTAVRVYLKRIVIDQGVPFPVQRNLTVNGFTPEFEREVLQASADAEAGKNLSKEFTDMGELIADLQNDDED